MSAGTGENRKRYQSPWFFIILIPIGMFFLFVLIDYGVKVYNDKKFNKDAKEIVALLVDIKDDEDLIPYAREKFTEKGYEEVDLTILREDGVVKFIGYTGYFSMIKEITHDEKSLVTARYKAYYNEQRDLIIEDYDPNNDI